jgi:hypothetical protein
MLANNVFLSDGKRQVLALTSVFVPVLMFLENVDQHCKSYFIHYKKNTSK